VPTFFMDIRMKFKLSIYTAVLATSLLAWTPLYAAQINTQSTLVDTVPEHDFPASARFTKVIDDLPLMPGLQLVEDRDLLFSEPVLGRIAETNAEGPVDIDDVYHFYQKSLLGLGWKMIDARNYLREQDHLRIDAHADGKVTTVRFSVRPN